MFYSLETGEYMSVDVPAVSKLIYAAGDVPEPDLDSVDYMEDLVVEFIADLVTLPPVTPQPR